MGKKLEKMLATIDKELDALEKESSTKEAAAEEKKQEEPAAEKEETKKEPQVLAVLLGYFDLASPPNAYQMFRDCT
ncbi:hypothetical protein G6F42_015361 [Rhizopus arrhizus]|nr:hypothetical protein G6F42_015361 [Rhizopus arrhizus]